MSPQALALHAIQRAVDDAGLDVSVIDGIVPISNSIPAEDVISNFNLPHVGLSATLRIGGASAVGSLGLAATALQTHRCRYVVIYIGKNGSSGERMVQRVSQLPGYQFRRQLEEPFGWGTPLQWYAMMCRRHMELFGTTKEHLARVSLTMRKHAQNNSHAQMYGKPMTREDYYASPMISDPYQLFDCCLETDGGAAIIVTSEERARDLRKRPVVVSGWGVSPPQSPDDLTNRPDWNSIGLTKAAPDAYSMAGIGPHDISALMVYDCFTFEVIQQLEEAGFCGRGEGGPFVASGAIEMDGQLPVNPHGGLLSEGHMTGLNHLIEAVRQLRGECTSRQLPRLQFIGVTGWGNLGDGSMAILRRDHRG